MRYQMHWQFKDGKTEMKTHFEIEDSLPNNKNNLILIQEVDYAKITYPIPDGAIWMMCNQKSKHYVGGKTNFQQWSDRYYPDEDDETLKKMSHAWASGNVSPVSRLLKIAGIIESVDNRCMAADGPVTLTLDEMRQEEISEIYELASKD